jgi:hypothetical protein
LWIDPELTGALFEHFVADRYDQLRLGHDAPPQPAVQPRRWSCICPDDVVGKGATRAHYRWQGVFHRITTVGHHGDGTEPRKEMAKPQSDARLEAFGSVAASRVTEIDVDFHLGGPVEEPEESVANASRLVESVDQDACRSLRTSAAWRRDDVHDERSRPVIPEMRRHRPSILPGSL